MDRRIRTLATRLLITVIAYLVSLPQATLADDGTCKTASGKLSVVNSGNGTTSGTMTHGGKLNGTTHAVFTSGFTPTSDSNTVSYTDDFTVTTNNGVLTAHNVGIFDVAAGVFSEIARIDPNVSTRNFAGATGVLYINGTTMDGGVTFQAAMTGEICFAH